MKKAKKEPNTKNFGYTLLESMPIKEGIDSLLSLPKKKSFSRKHILAELCKTNTSCVCCGVKGTKFILGKDTNGSLHWDLYSDDETALSIDHIIPKSKGGENKIENTQIMCVRCNWFKLNLPWRLEVFKKLLDTGLEIKLHTTGKPFVRIGFWQKMSDVLWKDLSKFLDEESILDEDCGYQYTYYFKNKTDE